MDNRNIRKEESAVSPVIGVILMVAITVILAAVIGAFVFGMGTPEKTPAANVEIISANGTTIVLEHRGGDDLSMDDVKIIVKPGGGGAHTADPVGASGLAFSAGGEVNLCNGTLSATKITGWGGTWDTIPAMTVGKMVEVELWYNPTGQRIAVLSKAVQT